MSGVTGNNKIQSRKDFREILKTAEEIIKDFPGFVSIEPTGSYNSDKKKTTFGDIDLITHIDGSVYDNDKKKIKSALAKHFKVMSDSIIVPFASEKYAGKKYYNSGEIITISLNTPNPSILPCQVDYMIAMDASETKFKKDFLDMPAAKQGIVLGLIKTSLIEQQPNAVFKRLKIKEDNKTLSNVEEFEFNLSSKEIQLRRVQYDKPGSFKQASRQIVWTSRDWNDLSIILKDFDLGLSFDKLVAQAKSKLKKTRSSNRMAGVFKSMISIKSGEVGKQKGIDKQKALDKVQKLFGEDFKDMKFSDFINESNKVNFYETELEVEAFGYTKSTEFNSQYSTFTKGPITLTIKKVRNNSNLKEMSGFWKLSSFVYVYDSKKEKSVKSWLEMIDKKDPKRKPTINEKTVPYKKGTEYKIEFENESAFGEFIGTGKGTLSPNKGKEVYIFKAVIDEDDYKDGKIKVGFWEIEQNRTKIIEVS